MASPAPIWIQAIISGALVVGAIAAWSERERLTERLGLTPAEAAAPASDAASEGLPVVLARVGTGRDDLTLRTVGTALAERSVMLRPETEGKIAALALSANRAFATGDVLMRLDDTDQRLALALAEARLAEADRDLARTRTLQTRGTLSETALTSAATAHEIARIERDRAAEALSRREVRAPFDGVSGIPKVEIGDWVDTGTVIASYDDRARLLVEFSMPERWLGRLSLGAPVEIAPPGSTDPRLGEVAVIDSRVDPETRTATIRAALDNSEDRFRPGASFALTLRLPGKRYPSLPVLAYQFSQDGGYVWRAEDGVAARVPVRLVRRMSGSVLVSGGIEPGDLVVVEGTQRVREGRKLRPVIPPDPPGIAG